MELQGPHYTFQHITMIRSPGTKEMELCFSVPSGEAMYTPLSVIDTTDDS